MLPLKRKLAEFEGYFFKSFWEFSTSNFTAKPLLKFRLSSFLSFSLNLKNQKPSTEKTKTFNSIQLRYFLCLTLSWRRLLSCTNQSIDLQSKSMDWFLYDNGLRLERVKSFPIAWE